MNKRRYYRLDRHFMVSYRTVDSKADFQMAQTKDISENGLAVLSGQPYRLGERLDMMVTFPFRLGERVPVTGKIVACVKMDSAKEEYRIGVQFVSINSSIVEELSDYINQFKGKGG